MIDNFSSLQTEEAILSIMLCSQDASIDAIDLLTPDCFTNDAYRMIFAEIKKQASSAYDVVTISNGLKGAVSLQMVGNIAASFDGSPRAVNRHAKALIDLKKNRMLYSLSVKLGQLSIEDAPIDERIDLAQAEMLKLHDVEDADEWIDAYSASIAHTELIENRADGKIKGISTGLDDLDAMIHGGLHKGNLFIIGARPAMGKTALAMTIGLNIARTHSVGFLSMEMPHADVRDRQAAMLSNIPISSIKTPSKEFRYDKIIDAVEDSRHLKFYVSDKSGLNINNVRSKARALKRKSGLDVLIVDYIGLMSGTDSKMSRAYQIEEISRGLKSLAKDLDIVVLCLAQVNRAAVGSADKPPGLHDLRDSGAIEQDADIVAFIHRPIASEPTLGSEYNNYALLRVSKNRQGKTGDVHLSYQGDITKFGQWMGEAPSKPTTRNQYKSTNL